MPTPPDLVETQRRFFELITAPEDVARTLAARDLSPSHVEDMVAGDGRRSALGRLDIYANMYFFRLLEILKADHPAVAAALGDERFHNLATDYLQAHPSRDPSVRYVSRHLPSQLDGWLKELALLEQARLDVFDAAEATLWTLDDLRQHPDLASLPLALAPATRRLQCRFAVDQCWDQADEGRPVEPPDEAPRTFLVWRHEVSVFHRVLEADEAPLLGCGTFGLVCEALAASQAPEEAAARAFALLARWVGDGILAH
jgi:hypothetical protein